MVAVSPMYFSKYFLYKIVAFYSYDCLIYWRKCVARPRWINDNVSIRILYYCGYCLKQNNALAMLFTYQGDEAISIMFLHISGEGGDGIQLHWMGGRCTGYSLSVRVRGFRFLSITSICFKHFNISISNLIWSSHAAVCKSIDFRLQA